MSRHANISISSCYYDAHLNEKTLSWPYLIGLSAIQSLHRELAAYPKPGLVSPVDSGSHRDMDAALFFRSLFSLRSYFRDVAIAGTQAVPFAALKSIAIAAEAKMMAATSGVNTHRGAIFNLGLLAAAAGALWQKGLSFREDALGEEVRKVWGEEIREHGRSLHQASHGRVVASRYGVGGALEEAAAGFPHIFKVSLPILQNALAQGATPNDAAVQCLFGLMAVLPDTNLLYRGGEEGLRFSQDAARQFLADGGVHQEHWRERAVSLHREFVDRNLSPGGCADLLAATLFINSLQLVCHAGSG
jgi:triphosphoribosyl-dephospho-CoA synthase